MSDTEAVVAAAATVFSEAAAVSNSNVVKFKRWTFTLLDSVDALKTCFDFSNENVNYVGFQVRRHGYSGQPFASGYVELHHSVCLADAKKLFIDSDHQKYVYLSPVDAAHSGIAHKHWATAPFDPDGRVSRWPGTSVIEHGTPSTEYDVVVS